MRREQVFSAILLVLIGFVGYHLVYLQQQGRVTLIQTQIAKEEATQATQREVSSLLSQLERYQTRLPQAPNPAWLVQEAVTHAQAAGIELATITQEAPQSYGHYTRLGISLQFAASYHQLGAFLDSLERSNNFVRVERVELGNRSQQQSEAGGSVRVVLSTLHLPGVEASAAAVNTHGRQRKNQS